MKLQHFLLGAVMALTSATAAVAEPIGRPDYPPLFNKIDQFAYAVDTSGSMMMTMPGTGVQKMVLAQQVLGEINSRVPELPYISSFYALCPAKQIIAPAPWNRLATSKAISSLPSDLPIYGRMTDLGGDLAMFANQFPTQRGAVILVTDGVDNWRQTALATAKNFAANGTLLHIISFAETEEGRDTIAAIAKVNPKTIVVNGMTLLMSPASLDAFVKAVFYEEGTPTVLESVYFATGKYNLDATAQATLDRVAAVVLDKPRGVRSVDVQGFTDSVGGNGPANSVLSNKRAAAVRDYLNSKGVSVDKVYVQGNSVSYKFNNANNDGRMHNRRVDLIIN